MRNRRDQKLELWYQEQKKLETPNLWARIEEGLMHEPSESSSDVLQKEKQSDIRNRKNAFSFETIAGRERSDKGSKHRKGRAIVKAIGGVSAACLLIVLLLPLVQQVWESSFEISDQLVESSPVSVQEDRYFSEEQQDFAAAESTDDSVREEDAKEGSTGQKETVQENQSQTADQESLPAEESIESDMSHAADDSAYSNEMTTDEAQAPSDRSEADSNAADGGDQAKSTGNESADVEQNTIPDSALFQLEGTVGEKEPEQAGMVRVYIQKIVSGDPGKKKGDYITLKLPDPTLYPEDYGLNQGERYQMEAYRQNKDGTEEYYLIKSKKI